MAAGRMHVSAAKPVKGKQARPGLYGRRPGGPLVSPHALQGTHAVQAILQICKHHRNAHDACQQASDQHNTLGKRVRSLADGLATREHDWQRAQTNVNSAWLALQGDEGTEAQEVAYEHVKKSIQGGQTLTRYHGLRAAMNMLALQVSSASAGAWC